ncbi:Peroxisome biogenesis factor 10 [Paramicrosporidium saccamoebae]|uniref:RING-type E3 ubiquitin transferase n=1 Tax=Paramicrosporidium saccamoebae TaxID=1246581 RepID=A0A2H9TQ58_9FUNG|nr:Peroxisome biogenesis factor 10 [Paramicrosporidium saccamoebae]
MRWGFAETSVIARAHQKDQFYIHQLDDKLRRVLNMRHVYRWIGADTLPLSSALYYALTTLAGTKTLGEEYCQILPVDVINSTVPPVWKRIVLTLMPFMRLLESAESFNKVLFYWEGRYPTLIRRILSLRYIYHPRRAPDTNGSMFYRLLAIAALPVAILKLTQRATPSTIEEVPRVATCSLCLGRRRATTVTKCGHLFCWDCIFSWTKMRPECPLCRSECLPAHLFCVIDPYIQNM